MRWLCCAVALLFSVRLMHADEQVRRVQEELRKRNLYFGDIDGRKTPEFEGAVRHYQERKGFAPTGELDASTLHSLELGPAPPGAETWPDIPVIKSDTGREQRAENLAAAASPSTAALPPIMESGENAAPLAGEQERFPPEEVRRYIENYLRDCETNNLKAEMSYYADRVDYFERGPVDRGFVEDDVKNYYKRWPERKYELLDISQTPVESKPNELQVKFRINFTVKNKEHTVRGKTDNLFTLKDAGSGYKIVALHEERVR